jgi:autotransporter strand-loop-strand O-heptosyltransferase
MENKLLNSEETKKKYIEAINNTIINKRSKLKKLSIKHNFVDGAFFELIGNVEGKYNIRFYDNKNDELIHESTIGCNMWTKTSRKYFTDWRVEARDEAGNLIYNNSINHKTKRVYISFDSSSLGDNIAWIPYVEEFRKKHDCEVVVSTFFNDLFEKAYPNIKFAKPGDVVDNLYAMYKIGCFYDSDLEPELCNTIPLQKVASNILGLEYKEIKPEIYSGSKKIWPISVSQPYVTIAPHSTAGLKYWNNETGWQEVVDYLKESGYRVFNVSREGCDINGVENLEEYSIEKIISCIKGSEFFIGLSSGLSWLSWAIGKHVFLISNFTNKEHEFSQNCTRIYNESVCNSCWGNPDFRFDKGDWNWCPLHKGTERQFECSKSITGKDVIKQIEKHLNKDFDWGDSGPGLINELSKEIFEDKIYERLFEVKEGDVVIDVGASIGPFTYSILKKNPKKVYCLEPSVPQFKTLSNNFKNSQVTCINKAISKNNQNIDGKYVFGDEKEAFPGIDFNTLLNEYDIDVVNFLKLDCEGGEYDIFTKENVELIKNRVDKVAAEFHLRTPELKEKFKCFRDDILKQFDNYKVLSLDGVDITWSLFEDDFINFYKEVMIYIENK